MSRPWYASLDDVITEAQAGFACGDDDPDGVFQIRMNNVTRTGSLDLSKKRRVPADHKSVRASTLKVNDVLFNATNSPGLVGKTTLFPGLDETTVYSNHFLRLRTDHDKLIPSYLAHWLQSRFDAGAFKAMCKQWVNQATVGKDYLLNLKIPLLPISEQRRIAQVLNDLGALRAERRRVIALLDDLAQVTFLDTFDSGGYPPNSTLGNHLEFVTSGSRGWAKYYSLNGARFIRSVDVRMNEIDNRDPAYVIAPNNSEARRTRVEEGDVLLTITGSLIGRVAPVPASLRGSYISQHVAILRASTGSLRPQFLAFYLSLPSGGQRQIRKMQYGQTKPGLNFQQIRSFRVPVPTISVQDSFLRQLAAIKHLQADQISHLVELDALFASIQHRAFCGEL